VDSQDGLSSMKLVNRIQRIKRNQEKKNTFTEFQKKEMSGKTSEMMEGFCFVISA
jgi:hypothetical protein